MDDQTIFSDSGKCAQGGNEEGEIPAIDMKVLHIPTKLKYFLLPFPRLQDIRNYIVYSSSGTTAGLAGRTL